MSTVRVSAAVAARNAAGSIGACLDALSPYCDEVVVVDGGSGDGTAAAAAAVPRVRLYRRDAEEGVAGLRNFAIDQCFGDFILRIDADEIIAAGGERRLRLLTRVPGLRWFSLPGASGVRTVRLFRNLPEFRYEPAPDGGILPIRGLGVPLGGPRVSPA